MATQVDKRSEDTDKVSQEADWNNASSGQLSGADSPWTTSMIPDETYDDASMDAISWSASEYIHHEKSSSWYIKLGLVSLPLIVAIYFFTGRDVVAVVASVVIVLIFGVGATRPPRSLDYKIDDHGITIGPRHFSFASFKSFAVMDENALQTVVLAPLKRFLPPLSLYCPPEQADAIINTIGHYLPFEPKSDDPIDMLMRKLRF